MQIRSLTLFCQPSDVAADFSDLFARARTAFAIPLQTLRVATTPFPDWAGAEQPHASIRARVAAWQQVGADYVSIGPVLLRHSANWLDAIEPLIAASDITFASAEIADRNGAIDIERSGRVAALVQRLSRLHANGFGNLYFTATANCPPGSPFFPVGYAADVTSFALAVESADLAVTAFSDAESLREGQRRLTSAIEREAQTLIAAAERLATAVGVPFSGIDFSLAPFPTPERSIGTALEQIAPLGERGALFAAALLTSAIQQADFPGCGFSGLMLPLLEDSALAARATQLTIGDLLSYAAVCGVGLDTVPLPGDVSQQTLTAILLDVAALAVRAGKPLTARLMPAPGLQAGDPITFDFPYFADSCVMPASGSVATKTAAPLIMPPYQGNNHVK